MIAVLRVCLALCVVLVLWGVLDPTPALDGLVLVPALLIAAVALVIAAAAERGHR
ncbi:hypothetical protein [Cellulomonas olei]|uniref:hypothetical protein n=1 Tax=Cellulomonas sp. P4 TaxID=3142533 RepID=UPI0031BB7895